MSSARTGLVSRRSGKGEYIETETGNKISRRSHIEGKQNIMLAGKSVIMADVVLRGDLCRRQEKPGEEDKAVNITAISIGKATVIATGCTIRPPMRLSRGQMVYYPMRIGDNVFIGPGTHVSSVSISSHVHIGEGCVLMPFSVIKDSCQLLPHTVVPPHMVIPPGSVVGGSPARVLGDVPEGWGQTASDDWVEGGDLRGLVRTIK
ncbi:trimeric LpxA-like protein [Piedraia hortae CBS 480.64]|uniref:Dynactin subunit 5 n=1 Tax=Piedraia hortae CBS 480.64 TaxID=1314780 RepID=A0A6A7BRD7_9PEZI|nr:trimeric LpxA-like protein [Piedraia hortae CBS 480.64]